MDLLALGAVLLLLVVWLGYPVAIALMSSRRQRDRASAALVAPTVSVVVATRDDEDVVRSRVLDALRTDFDPSKVEVIVGLDAHSASAAAGIVTADVDPARVRVVRGDPPGGKAATLNAAVRVASGDVIVFADAHQRFETHTISELVAPFADPAVGAVSGSLRLGTADPTARGVTDLYWVYERWLRRSEARLHSSIGATGAVYAIRRRLWEPLPPGLILDDVLVPMRVVLGGSRVVWAEDARAHETRSPSGIQEYRRKVRTLTGVLQLCAWAPALLSPRRNPVWLQFVFHKLLRLLTPYLLVIIAVWAAARLWSIADGLGGAVLVAASLAASLLMLAWRVLRAPARRSFLFDAVMLQAAVVMATFNGLRGRWDVWR